MYPSLIQIGSKTAEKNPALTDRHYTQNNGHLAVNQYFFSFMGHRETLVMVSVSVVTFHSLHCWSVSVGFWEKNGGHDFTWFRFLFFDECGRSVVPGMDDKGGLLMGAQSGQNNWKWHWQDQGSMGCVSQIWFAQA